MSYSHKVSLTLKQDGHSISPYKITKIENSTEWKIGQRLTKTEVDQILDRRVPNEVKVIVK